MLVLIDNFDSFTYNLVQYFHELGQEVRVIRNDAASPQAIIDLSPTSIVISPGPGSPKDAGICIELLRLAVHTGIPTLGVCLGHQCIAELYGAAVTKALYPMHGKCSQVTHNASDLFAQLPNPLRITRYHSLVVDPETLPPTLEGTAWTSDGELMALKHKNAPLWGVQFHPESILTQGGHDLLQNFLRLSANAWGSKDPCGLHALPAGDR